MLSYIQQKKTGGNKMDKIVEWLKSCGYSENEAAIEANKMIEANRWDGVEMCSREYAISMILDSILD